MPLPDPEIQAAYTQANMLQVQFATALDKFSPLKPASVMLACFGMMTKMAEFEPGLLEPETLAWLLTEWCGIGEQNDVAIRPALMNALPIMAVMRAGPVS